MFEYFGLIFHSKMTFYSVNLLKLLKMIYGNILVSRQKGFCQKTD